MNKVVYQSNKPIVWSTARAIRRMLRRKYNGHLVQITITTQDNQTEDDKDYRLTQTYSWEATIPEAATAEQIDEAGDDVGAILGELHPGVEF